MAKKPGKLLMLLSAMPGAALLSTALLTDVLTGSNNGFGKSQTLMVLAGFFAMIAGIVLARRMSTHELNNRACLFRLVLLGVSFVIAFALSEVICAVVISKFNAGKLRIFEFDAAGTVEGIGVKKNFSQTWLNSEFSVEIDLNNIGLRERDDYQGENIDIGFYGDSFTFGHGVNFGERYSDVLRQFFPSKKIVSFSYRNGWTTPHYYLFVKRHPDLLPETGVLGLFLGNDLTCDIEETQLRFDKSGELTSVFPLVRTVDKRGFLVNKRYNLWERIASRTWTGEMVLRVLNRLGIRGSRARGANSQPSLQFDRGQVDDASTTALQFIKELDDHFRAENRRFVVFLIPRSFYVGEYDCNHDREAAVDIRENQYLTKRIVDWCREHGVEVINPIPEFKKLEQAGVRLYFERDGHWNARGHSEAARILATYLQQGTE